MTPLVDPYAVLGVTPQDSQEEINSAYRRLVRLHHPDTSTSTESSGHLERVLAAYAMLRDPRRRAEYDRRHPRSAPTAAPPTAAPTVPPTMPPGMMRVTLTIRVQPARRPDAA